MAVRLFRLSNAKITTQFSWMSGMAEMDGRTAAQAIRKLRPTKGPRIVAITAYALEGDREKCLEAGMDDYTTKPVELDNLKEASERFSSPCSGSLDGIFD